MKRCPECRKDYVDDSLLYCLDDGTALVQGPVADESATAVLSGEALTKQQATDGTGRVTLSLPAFLGSKRLPWIIIAILLLALVGGGWMYYRRTRSAEGARVLKFNIAPPKDETFGESVAISPDGKRIAFTSQSAAGDTALWVRSLGDVEPVKLAGTEGATFPFWSPDSRWIAFFALNKLKKVDGSGGPPQIIADTSPAPRGGTWGADGTILFSPLTTTPLMKVSASGGEVTQVTELDTSRGEASHRWPCFLPDSKHFLYFARGGRGDQQGVVVASLDGKEKKFLFGSRVAAVYAPPGGAGGNGRLLFARDGALMAQEFDLSSLALVGDPVAIAPNVQSYPTEAGPTALTVASASNDGTLIYRTGSTAVTQLRWTDRSGKAADTVGNTGIYHEPVLAPDGKHVSVSLEEAGKGQDIWTIDLARNVATRLTFDPSIEGSSLWSRDGSTIYFSSNRTGGSFAVYKKASSGTGNEELVYSLDGEDLFVDSISPDGRWLLIDHGGRRGTAPFSEAIDLTSKDKPIEYTNPGGALQHAQFSPDGKWISYSSDESGRPDVYVQPFPPNGGKWQISTGGGDQALWNPNGKEIFYVSPDRHLISVPLTTGASFQVGQPTVLFQTTMPVSGLTDARADYLFSADGQRILINGLIDAVNATPITVVVNWGAAVTY